jgi:type I restriction enzyme, S subunit
MKYSGTSHWQMYTLEETCERVTVGIATSVTGHYRETGVPIIRNLNIKPNKLDESEVLYISPEFAEVNSTCKCNFELGQ